MAKSLICSIIICTYNHAESLTKTLQSLSHADMPANISCELIVVDNASTDHTAKVINSYKLPNMQLRYIYEPRRGQCYARNAGIAAANGDIILFTDDDVHPLDNWIEGMCGPISSDQAHAVAGRIKIAPHLERSWMEKQHRWSLGDTDYIDPQCPEMIGANMAFAREVLSEVPGFDTELGPGALGFGDDTLFSRQLHAAGYTLSYNSNAAVEHHFEEFRLLRVSFLDRMRKGARSLAYTTYHWEHQIIPFPQVRLGVAMLRLVYWRTKRRQDRLLREGISLWEMSTVSEVHFYKQYLKEIRRPFNYEKNGLKKLELTK